MFYEGNSCTQDRLFSVGKLGVNQCGSSPSACLDNNDEARSMHIKFDRIEFGTIVRRTFRITLYDSPTGATDKDIAEITIYGRPARGSTFCVSTLNKSATWDVGSIDFRRGRTDDGKLDGKLSRVDLGY